MRKALKYYKSSFEDELNIDLITKSADEPLVDYIVDAWKSLEVVPQIHFDRYEYTEKESEIDVNKYLFKREKRKKKKDRHDIKLVNDDRVGLLTVYLTVTMLETDPTTNETTLQSYPIKKAMLVPLQDENGYFHLGGKNYYLIYQLLEKSTYVSSTSVTLKSLMPIACKRTIISVEDINGKEYQLPSYYVYVFRKEIPILLFFMYKGIDFAIDSLDINGIVRFVDKLPKNAKDENCDYIYIQISSKCFLEANKILFNKYTYIQAMVGGFCDICTNRTTINQLNDPKQWIKKIANPANYEKGLSISNYFGRLMDKTTQRILKLPEYHKYDIYALIRWMMEEFNTLRLKDNCDLSNKRLRCNEYIASLLNAEFSRRLYKVITMGDKATIDTIRDVFKFPGDILIQKMHLSGIMRFNDEVNDMSFWSHLKFTNKGPHSLGGNNSNNIGIKYRDLHPSFLSQIDVLVCGNSDPGTSGTMSPFAKIKGLYFNDDDEPVDTLFNIVSDVQKIYEDKHLTYIKLDFDNPKDYYKVLDNIHAWNYNNIKISETSREGHYELIINEESDIDDKTAPSTKMLQKKNRKKKEEDK